jgi:protein TonB
MYVYRFAGSLPPAALAAAALLFLMQYLVRMDGPKSSALPELRAPSIASVKDEEPVRESTPPPEPQPVPDVQPPPPAFSFEHGATVGQHFALDPPMIPRDVGFSPGSGIVDGDLSPLVLVQPVYPDIAARRGLEGFVTVEFTVAASGAVQDVKVVESTHRVFEGPAVQAAYKCRYRPRVVQGQAVAVSGMRQRFTFAIEK